MVQIFSLAKVDSERLVDSLRAGNAVPKGVLAAFLLSIRGQDGRIEEEVVVHQRRPKFISRNIFGLRHRDLNQAQ